MKTRLQMALVLGLVSAIAGAEPAESLPTVQIVASPITQEEKVTADGAELVMLTRDQLGTLNAQDVQTALRQVPGVTVSRYAPVGSYGGGQGGSVYVRGLGTARPGGELRLYTDGAPRESGVWGHPLMDSMPIDFARSLTVVKNPHPAYAADTFAAIDVATRRRTEEGHEGELQLAAGRYGTMLSSASVGAKYGAVDGYGGVAYRRSHGLRAHNQAELESAFARFGLDLSDFEHIGFVYQRTDSKVEDPGPTSASVPRLDRFDLATDLFSVRFETKGRESVEGFTLFYCEHGDIAWHKDHLTDGVPASPAGDADTTWLNWGTRSRYEVNPWARLWLTGALDLSSEGGHTKNIRADNGRKVFGFAGRLASVSPYAGVRYDFELGEAWRLVPSAGLRYYHHETYDDTWAPCAALKLKWEEGLEFFADATRGVHYPGIYTRAVAADFARRTLDAEQLDTVALGVKGEYEECADVTLSVFHAEVSDRIDKLAAGFINSGSLRTTGTELSGHWRPTDELSLFAGGTFSAPTTHPASRLPRWTAALGGTWKLCRYLEWSVDGNYLGSMYAYSVRAEADARNLRKLDDAFICNTRLALPLESVSPLDGEVYVALENFTRTRYCYYPDYPMGGVMWYVGCRLRF